MREYPKIYSQRDPIWAAQRLGTVDGATIGQYGCLLTCHAMKAGYYGHDIQPNALDDTYTNRNLYVSGDLLTDADLHAVFDDIQLVESKSYVGVPADLNYLKEKASDPTLTVTIEVDFDHDPNDGIQTHFVELHEFDGTTLTIYDPWYGGEANFALHYGTDPATTIQKVVIYKGAPGKPPVLLDSATFEKLVTNSSANDAVCDELNLSHDIGKDAEVSAIKQLKLETANSQSTIENLNKQIPSLELEISTLKNQVANLTQKLNTATDQANQNTEFKNLYEASEEKLKIASQATENAVQQYNRAIGQYQNTSALLLPLKRLSWIFFARTFKLPLDVKGGAR